LTERPRIRPLRLLIAWVLSAAALFFAAAIVPGVSIEGWKGALLVAAIIGVLNAVLPPVLAAIRLPFTLITGLLLVLVLDALMFELAARIAPSALTVDSFGDALLAAFVASALSVVLDPIFRTNDDEWYMLRVTQRIARRTEGETRTDKPGIVFLEIDGLGLPTLRRAVRDGSAPEMARWLAEEGYTLTEWETDLSSQTGASQAGILLGSNDDIPAFRWVEKESGRTMTCSKPADCAEIERRHVTGAGLLSGGGASRGNLLSGEAEQVILTVSRIEADKRANPGYRVFFANGFNVTRLLVLFAWEVILEWTAAGRAKRRDVRPRGHRGGAYPFMRATMCVIVRDLIVYGVITDMLKGRPAVYATFSSYDEVAHHSGLERADTLEALRKLDEQFGRIARARRYTPRPYELIVLSDHGQTQGATFRQRNGYALADLVNESLESGGATAVASGDENAAMVGNALKEATGARADGKEAAPQSEAAVLASGNLGLVYLLDEARRLTLEEIQERHPRLLPALRAHPHVGFVLAHSTEHGAVALGARGMHRLADGHVEGDDPLAPFAPNARRHLLRTDEFAHAPDLLVNSFFDPVLEEGCAFEELISFHGGLGGPQTRPFLLHPEQLTVPDEPIVGAAAVHELLTGWRTALQGEAPASEAAAEPARLA
jgi:uncharacterized membrane protein YvlD (DUF360 family)